MFERDTRRIAPWYFGGLASMTAATFTHPLDLLKVLLQTPGKQSASLPMTTINIIKTQGILALYNGLTASWLRQATYSTTRFGIYETAKKMMSGGTGSASDVPFYQRTILAGVSGAAGGFVGTPGDLINVRMQNDIKLPMHQRRNYKHAIDGLFQIVKHEGFKSLFNGASTATSRAVLVTIGQLGCYDQFKLLLLTYMPSVFEDNLTTHFTCSFLAGSTATAITQPLDVMKTRMMNAKPGEYTSVGHCALTIHKASGIGGFFKGFVPAFVRLGPHTILMFIFLEQYRQRFGYLPSHIK